MHPIKTTTVLALALALIWPVPGHAIAFNSVASVGLGQIEFSTPLTGDVELGTNGQKQYTGNFTGSSGGTAGALEVQDTAGTQVDISCTPAVLANTSGGTVAASVEVTAGNGSRNSWGMNPACTDIATPVLTHTLTASTPDNTLYFGMRIAPTSITDSAYTTGNLNGQAISVRAVVH